MQGAHGPFDDRTGIELIITQVLERCGNALIDDFEVTAASKFLELDQREVRLNARRIAVHQQADRTGWRQHGCLCIAIAVLFAQCDGVVPLFAGCLEHFCRNVLL